MNARAKGARVQRKALRFALSFPHTTVLPLHQTSRWATPQPFDLLVLRERYWPRFVEVRANAWRTRRQSTVDLTDLPGEGFLRQIWMFPDHVLSPRIRQWDGAEWIHQDHPWEEE